MSPEIGSRRLLACMVGENLNDFTRRPARGRAVLEGYYVARDKSLNANAEKNASS